MAKASKASKNLRSPRCVETRGKGDEPLAQSNDIVGTLPFFNRERKAMPAAPASL
jgi:hypothetical protein